MDQLRPLVGIFGMSAGGREEEEGENRYQRQSVNWGLLVSPPGPCPLLFLQRAWD